jgi:hypothetical protein
MPNPRPRKDPSFSDLLSRHEMLLARSRTTTELEIRLERCPALKNALIWRYGSGKAMGYRRWPKYMKRRLSELFDLLCKGETNLNLQLPSLQSIYPNNHAAYFTREVAFDVYAAHAAHVLYVEAKRLVPWSITTLPHTQLKVLLSSDSYHAPIAHWKYGNYPPGIQAGRDFQEAPQHRQLAEFISDPRIGYDFLTGHTSRSGKNLIGSSMEDTLANLTVWLLDNVGHGDRSQRTDQQLWLSGRLKAVVPHKVTLAIVGCHSASKLMVDLARSVNIPLLHVRTQDDDRKGSHFFNRTHGGLVFRWGEPTPPRILWHTDELYAFVDSNPCFPIRDDGAQLSSKEAVKLHFETRWRTPAQLIASGFYYHLHLVRPGVGFGVPVSSNGYDRYNYGMMAGYWKKEGSSNLAGLARLEQDYELCSKGLLYLFCRQVLNSQLAILLDQYKGGLSPADFPSQYAIAEYSNRAEAAIASLGGCATFAQAVSDWADGRGSDLIV